MAVGALNTGFSYVVYSTVLFLGLSVLVASLASLIFGILLGFSTQGILVFRHLSALAFFRFLANWGIMYCVYIGVVMGVAEFGVTPYLGGLIALIVTVPLSYFMLNKYVFRMTATASGMIAPRQSEKNHPDDF